MLMGGNTMSYSANSALRDATRNASLEFYNSLEEKTLLAIDKLTSNPETPDISVAQVQRELGINYRVLGKIFSSLSNDGAVEFFVSPDLVDKYAPKDMIVELTENGRLRTRRAVENMQRKASFW